MSKLQFHGKLTVEQLFVQYRWQIYDNIIKSICANYKDPKIDKIEVVEISTGDTKYPIILSRDKFTEWLNRCIDFFEELEEYEKCQTCVNIIHDINKNNVNAN
jgi:hypothetical protein